MSDAPRFTMLRVTLALVAALDLISFVVFLAEARSDALAHGVAVAGWYDLVSWPPLTMAIVGLGIAAAVQFARAPGRLWAGAVTLVALAVLSTVHGRLYGSPWRHLFFSGVCLGGWLLGLAVSRRRGAPRDESYARIGSLALLGAAYLSSAISKMVFGGPLWMTGHAIQVIVVGQDGLVADGILSTYRLWAASTPAAAALFSFATLAFEGGAPLMIVGPWWRRLMAAGLIGMHTNILLLTDILYWESMVFLTVFGLLGREPEAESAAGWSGPSFAPGRLYAGSAVGLALCAALAIAHQSNRFAAHHGPAPLSAASPAAPVVASEPSPAPPTVVRLRRVGPFTLGQALGEQWTVESLHLNEAGFVVSAVAAAGRASFEVTCAETDQRSPFDLGAAHLFYSSQLAFADLEAAGMALQAQVRAAAAGRDPCAQIASWRDAARAGAPE